VLIRPGTAGFRVHRSPPLSAGIHREWLPTWLPRVFNFAGPEKPRPSVKSERTSRANPWRLQTRLTCSDVSQSRERGADRLPLAYMCANFVEFRRDHLNLFFTTVLMPEESPLCHAACGKRIRPVPSDREHQELHQSCTSRATETLRPRPSSCRPPMRLAKHSQTNHGL
jgi:hypothetical protein